MLNSVKLSLTLALLGTATQGLADISQIGRDATPEEVEAWDHDVRPDGAGLPEGSGTVEAGEIVFSEKCASCHGDFGEGAGRWPVLAGGQGSLTSEDPNKTIGSYWPYLSTVWDYINEAMPFGDARSLSADDIYGITAYLMYLNDLVEDDFELSKANFAEVRLPNEDGFYRDDRDEVEVPLFSAAACMENCVEGELEITARAADVGVTPEEEAAAEAAEAGATEVAAAEVASDVATDGASTSETATEGADPELIAAGEKTFKTCKACHQVGEGAKNGAGPELNAIMGRVPGTLEGFKYSQAMQDYGASGATWDDETLAGFLQDPKSTVKGTKMSFAGLKADEIDGILAYLSQY